VGGALNGGSANFLADSGYQHLTGLPTRGTPSRQTPAQVGGVQEALNGRTPHETEVPPCKPRSR